MKTTRVRGGVLQTPGGAVPADILIIGEKIGGILDRDEGGSTDDEIDATGKVVLPGLVDLHAHTRVPGYEDREDYLTGSQAAAVGGFTTFVDMPNVDPPTDSVELMLQKREIASRDCIIDWGHFPSGSKPENVAALAEAGATGFKIFMIGGGHPHDDRIAVLDEAQLFLCFEEIAKTGLPCLVHPFSQSLFDLLSKRKYEQNPDEPFFRARAEVYTRDIFWRTGVAMALELQRETGVRLHLLHSHAAGSIRLLKQAKAEGLPVTAAIDVKYFHVTSDDLDRVGFRAAPGGYVTADQKRMDAIWRALADGTIDLIDSDHAPHTLAEHERRYSSPLGSPYYELMLSLLLGDVNTNVLSLESLVRLCCENPARLIGAYPQKGALLPGSDADVVIVDLNKKWTVTEEGLYTKQKWSPLLGREMKGAPILTMLRGTVIARDGEVLGQPGFGRYIGGRPQRFVQPRPGQSPGLALAFGETS